MKKINAETLQGILQGESMDKIAKRLRNVQEMNKTQAIRSARTIVTGAENKGRQDSYARAEADGIILQKEWLATNDGRTRHSHAVLDGAIVDQDKKFDNGLMYPGDPSGRPEEVYNCRCTLVAKVNGFKKAQVQKAMAEKQVDQEKIRRRREEYFAKRQPPKEIVEYQNPTSDDYSNLGKVCRKNVSKEDQDQIFKHDGGGYVATHNYSTINSNLRKDGYAGNPLTNDDKKTISALDRAISKTQTDKDYVFTRYVNADYLTKQFGVYEIDFRGEKEPISNMILDFKNRRKQVPRITQELQKLIGTDDIDPAFLSTSMLPDKNIMKSKSVLIKIKAPKGTDVYVPKNRKESECIFGRGIKRTIESVEFNEQQNKWIITEVIRNG
jgi:SPP1 gp7 family putative phage head morphogenesis protein